MPKGTSAKEYRKRSSDELVAELKRLREELQTIRFTKVSGTAVAKLSKIKVKNWHNCNNFRLLESKLPDFLLLSEKTERLMSLPPLETEREKKERLSLSKIWNSSTSPLTWDPREPELSEEDLLNTNQNLLPLESSRED